MKVLNCKFKGATYNICPDGTMGNKNETYKFTVLGGSPSLMDIKVVVSLREAFKEPERLNNCYLWVTKDNGITIIHAPYYIGREAKLTDCVIKNLK